MPINTHILSLLAEEPIIQGASLSDKQAMLDFGERRVLESENRFGTMQRSDALLILAKLEIGLRMNETINLQRQ